MKVMFVFGTRPEVIKLFSLIKKFESKGKDEVILCSTGQQKKQQNQMLKFFNINPDYKLEIMKKSQSLSYISTSVLKRMDNYFNMIKPDIVFVQGDTTTAAFAAMAAFYNKIDIIHIEAGLRSRNLAEPFPEEFNRKQIALIAKYHIAPTDVAQNNLLKEGFDGNNIFVSGNTVVDALYDSLNIIKTNEPAYLRKFKTILKYEKFILVTAHRRENLGEPLKNICTALQKIAAQNKDIAIVFPVHLNPLVREIVFNTLADIKNVFLTNPLDYGDFLFLLSRCYIVVSDSGGVQEEAPSLMKPILVLRNTTERTELIDIGGAILVGVEKDAISHYINLLLNDYEKYRSMQVDNPFGDGKSAERIFAFINEKYREP